MYHKIVSMLCVIRCFDSCRLFITALGLFGFDGLKYVALTISRSFVGGVDTTRSSWCSFLLLVNADETADFVFGNFLWQNKD